MNSVILDARKCTRFMHLDVKDHFLAMPIEDPEHMRVNHKHVTSNIRERCNIN